tara:strand:- start:170 stop:730 length:561 start_codon:yes stop_codon:yes gene_type:complete
MIFLANKRDVISAIEERSDPRIVKIADEIDSEIARIIKNKNNGIRPDPRDDVWISNSVNSGKRTEIAYLIKFLDAEPSGRKEFDILRKSLRLEIKKSINMSGWTIPIKYGKSDYDYFYTCAKNGDVDFVIFCVEDNYGDIYMKYIADAKSFRSYVNLVNDSLEEYDVERAIEDGACKLIVEDEEKK